MLGIGELVILLAVVLVVFGAGKLSGVGKAVGKSVREFKEEVKVEETQHETEKEETVVHKDQ